MGVTTDSVRFLALGKKFGATFSQTITLGRMEVFAAKGAIASVLKEYGIIEPDTLPSGNALKYAEPVFEAMGAEVTDSLDVSDYEGATVLHDMNLSLPDRLKCKYSLVFDGGTLEHVFHFPQAIRNCMELLETGGHFIGISPANNTMGHGFYQFSPELYYRVFSPQNGFVVKLMLLATLDDQGNVHSLFRVADPAAVKGRVTLTNPVPAHLFVMAQKVSDQPVFEHLPQQSDYEMTWNRGADSKVGRSLNGEGLVKQWYRKYLPEFLKSIVRKVVIRLKARPINAPDIGIADARFFQVTSWDELFVKS